MSFIFSCVFCVAVSWAYPSAAVGQQLPAGGAEKRTAPAPNPPRRTLGELLPSGGAAGQPWRNFPLPRVDDGEVASHGIRKLAGRHLTLYTDLPAGTDVDELPQVFDLAVPQWCDYFAVPRSAAMEWKLVGYLIHDKQRFVRSRLLPADLPPFLHGYQRGAEIWVYEQPSAYYRRHLLLHEGTHAFMHSALGGAGPPWYMEGMAELLATHRWRDGQLTLRYFPRSKEEVPEWGRIKIVRDDYRAGQAKHLGEIMQYDERAHLQVEPYGWCWAAAAFLDSHPHYQQHFRELRKYVRDTGPNFLERFYGWIGEDWPHLVREWQWFVAHVDYGFDVAREAIEPVPAAAVPDAGVQIRIAADRGWQSTGVRLEPGETYRIQARGRYQLADEPKIWWSEPNGVTIRYHGGRPLGLLLGALVDEASNAEGSNGLLKPAAIGPGMNVALKRGGTLYLRINDDPAELADNAGEVAVQITRVPAP